jgi:hypothetical protein
MVPFGMPTHGDGRERGGRDKHDGGGHDEGGIDGGGRVTTTVVAVAAREEDSACGARQRRARSDATRQREGANVRQARVGSLRAGRRGRARINLPCTAIRSRWSRTAGRHCTCSIDSHMLSRSPCLCERGHAGGRCARSARWEVVRRLVFNGRGALHAGGRPRGRAPHLSPSGMCLNAIRLSAGRMRPNTEVFATCSNYLLLYLPGQILTRRFYRGQDIALVFALGSRISAISTPPEPNPALCRTSQGKNAKKPLRR